MNLIRSVGLFCSQRAGLLMGLILVGWMAYIPSAWAASPDFTDGSTLFELYCAGCHPQGGNIIRRRKTLKLKSLDRDGYNSLEALTEVVANGQNNMPGFEKKLNTTQIEVLAQFVLEQANQGWKKAET